MSKTYFSGKNLLSMYFDDHNQITLKNEGKLNDKLVKEIGSGAPYTYLKSDKCFDILGSTLSFGRSAAWLAQDTFRAITFSDRQVDIIQFTKITNFFVLQGNVEELYDSIKKRSYVSIISGVGAVADTANSILESLSAFKKVAAKVQKLSFVLGHIATVCGLADLYLDAVKILNIQTLYTKMNPEAVRSAKSASIQKRLKLLQIETVVALTKNSLYLTATVIALVSTTPLMVGTAAAATFVGATLSLGSYALEGKADHQFRTQFAAANATPSV